MPPTLIKNTDYADPVALYGRTAANVLVPIRVSPDGEFIPADYRLEVLRGDVPGHRMVSISGHDSTLDTTRTTITPTLTTANIDQSGLFTTPQTVDVASTSTADDKDSTGLRSLRIFGISASGEEISEVVLLEGQAEQTSNLLYSGINGWRAVTWGNGTQNAGTVWIGNGTFTSGVPDIHYFAGEIAENKGNTAYYVVPAGKTLYLRQLTINVATTNKDCDFYIEQSSNGLNWFTEQNFAMEPGEFQGDIIAVPGMPAGTHVRIEGISSNAATDVIAILGCELVDD